MSLHTESRFLNTLKTTKYHLNKNVLIMCMEQKDSTRRWIGSGLKYTTAASNQGTNNKSLTNPESPRV